MFWWLEGRGLSLVAMRTAKKRPPEPPTSRITEKLLSEKSAAAEFTIHYAHLHTEV